MQKAANFVAKYSTANKSKAVVPYDKIKATEKWVEYSLDIVDMNRILMKSDFDTKWRLMEALDVAERKRKYMYNHKNFKLKRATELFDLRNSPYVALSLKMGKGGDTTTTRVDAMQDVSLVCS